VLGFLDAAGLASFLAGAGLEIEEQPGDWDWIPVRPSSPEIITIARRSADLTGSNICSIVV